MSEPITESSEQLLKIKEPVTEQDLKNTVFNSNIEVGIYRSKELVVINGTENEIGMTADKKKKVHLHIIRIFQIMNLHKLLILHRLVIYFRWEISNLCKFMIWNMRMICK